MSVYKSFKDFARRLHVIANAVPIQSNKIKQRAALVLDQNLVLATPVDTGAARSNWLVSLEVPIQGTIDAYSPGVGLGIGETINSQAALEHAKRIINRSNPGQNIYISNNLPYIARLNEGHSAQAPAGFVEAALIITSQYIQSQQVLRK